jgi:hypothetical protein
MEENGLASHPGRFISWKPDAASHCIEGFGRGVIARNGREMKNSYFCQKSKQVSTLV